MLTQANPSIAAPPIPVSQTRGRRYYTPGERKVLHRLFGGDCGICGLPLDLEGAEVDHVTPWSKGGPTTYSNGQPVHAHCNNAVGTQVKLRTAFTVDKPLMTPSLRSWQIECVEAQMQVIKDGGIRFMVAAGVGAGKTIQGYGLYLASDFDMIIIVTPKTGIRGSWAEDGKALGLDIRSVIAGSKISEAVDEHGNPIQRRELPHGYVLTIGTLPSVQNDLKAYVAVGLRLLVVLDEVHHYGGKGSRDDTQMPWTRTARELTSVAAFTVGMSGTPYRSDDLRVETLRYKREDSTHMAKGVPCFNYPYERAVAEGHVAPMVARFIAGEIDKVHVDGRRETYRYEDGDYPNVTSKGERYARMQERLRLTAMESPEWQMAAIAQARGDLMDMRRNAPGVFWGGLIVCREVQQAKDLARRIECSWGDRCKVIVGDTDTEEAVKDYINDVSYLWTISITKISEGVSIDRLRVGVLLSSITTRNNFEQIWGRLVRLLKGIAQLNQAAVFYVPADPRLIDYTLEANQLTVDTVSWLSDEEIDPAAVYAEMTGEVEAGVVGAKGEVEGEAEAAAEAEAEDEAEAAVAMPLPVATGNTTAEQIEELRRNLTADRSALTINTGKYTLYARPEMDGAAIDGEFISEDAYLALRAKMAEKIDPHTAIRLNGSALEALSMML